MRSGSTVPNCDRLRLVCPRARGRKEESQTSSMRIASNRRASARSGASAWRRTRLRTTSRIEDLGVVRLRRQQVLGDRAAAWSRNQPSTDSAKKPILRLSMIRSGRSPRDARLSRYFVVSRRTLSPCGMPRAVLDHLVIEERHPNLQGVRHRGAVEVVEHVVDERQLRVDVQRRGKRRVREVPEPVGDDARAADPSTRPRAGPGRDAGAGLRPSGRSSRCSRSTVFGAESVRDARRCAPARGLR